jgi:hypothetical protein
MCEHYHGYKEDDPYFYESDDEELKELVIEHKIKKYSTRGKEVLQNFFKASLFEAVCERDVISVKILLEKGAIPDENLLDTAEKCVDRALDVEWPLESHVKDSEKIYELLFMAQI